MPFLLRNILCVGLFSLLVSDGHAGLITEHATVAGQYAPYFYKKVSGENAADTGVLTHNHSSSVGVAERIAAATVVDQGSFNGFMKVSTKATGNRINPSASVRAVAQWEDIIYVDDASNMERLSIHVEFDGQLSATSGGQVLGALAVNADSINRYHGVDFDTPLRQLFPSDGVQADAMAKADGADRDQLENPPSIPQPELS